MRIVDIRETVVPIKSKIRNAYIDFSQMTVSVLALVTAFRLRQHVKGEWLYLVFAVVSILFGLYVIVVPAVGLIYITLMISIYGFVAGITLIGLAFRARNAT